MKRLTLIALATGMGLVLSGGELLAKGGHGGSSGGHARSGGFSRTSAPKASNRPTHVSHNRPNKTSHNRPSKTTRPTYTQRPTYGNRPAKTTRPTYTQRPTSTTRPYIVNKPSVPANYWSLADRLPYLGKQSGFSQGAGDDDAGVDGGFDGGDGDGYADETAEQAALYGMQILDLGEGPALSQGMKVNDIILRINGMATPDFDSMRAALESSGSQAEVDFVNTDNGQVERITLAIQDTRIGATVEQVQVE